MTDHPNRAKRERLCEYGNCHNTNVAVTVNVLGNPAERPAFCGTQHAALWLGLHHIAWGPPRETLRETLEKLIGGGLSNGPSPYGRVSRFSYRRCMRHVSGRSIQDEDVTRTMQNEWAIDLGMQCDAAAVAFFMKQMSGRKPEKELANFPEPLRVREFPEAPS